MKVKNSIGSSLYGVVSMTPTERRLGRFLRAPDGHGGDMASAAGGGNNAGDVSGGNNGGNASGGSESNNTSNEFDPSSFWKGPAPSGDSASSGGSAGNSGSESGTNGGNSGEGGEFAQQLTQRLQNVTFGDPVFNAEVANQINEGDYSGVQERFNAMGRNIVREALAMQVQILRPFAEQLLSQVRSEQQQTLDQRDNTESLERLFPTAKNPVVAQTIRPIYEQALKNTGGNREQAVAQTKQMLRFMAGEAAGDLNLEVAPRGSGDRGSPTPNLNWLDELTSRN